MASPYVLTVASLIPLGISMGLAEEYFPTWKKYFKWFAADRLPGDCHHQHRRHGLAQEDRCPALPRRGGTGDLPRPILCRKARRRDSAGSASAAC
ncbi:MAG: hypothetical protein MZV64_59965 [Ignavibacteriales bacterium]|nr:hypothetical protein [Ignavibacteriales bacterium]